MLTRKEAISFLEIPEKHFDNYFKISGEIPGFKQGNRWQFDRDALVQWAQSRDYGTVRLSLIEYQECFEFAIKMAYSTNSRHGTGIRGQRSEVQMADDFILGILAEKGFAKFMKERHGIEVDLDMNVHPEEITPQDIISILKDGLKRPPNLKVGIKSSKLKNCFNIIDPLEYENSDRKSDVYIFARVDLPSDHLFRILRDHSFFKTVREFLEKNENFRKIGTLEVIPVWICGFSYDGEFHKVNEITNQKFEGERYVKSVGEMHHTAEDWKELISKM
jgi:hypothetical protein